MRQALARKADMIHSVPRFLDSALDNINGLSGDQQFLANDVRSHSDHTLVDG